MNETLLSADFTAHLERLKSRAQDEYSLSNLDSFICKYTYLDGNLFTFENHEYQIPLLKDTAKTQIIIKAAQIGMSELAYRWAIAAVCTQENFTAIYTFPSSGDAEKAGATRINPMIQSSPEVKRLVDPELNNSEIKRFNENSYIYFKGTRSTTQALSVPANAIIHDEFDASDTTQASVYISRLQHKPHKIRKIFSTPTIEKFGVSKEAETAKRFRHISKCEHCGHRYLPDFFKDVVVPDWTNSIRDITKRNLHETNWREAYLACPKCGKPQHMHHSRQEFVCENNAEDFEAHAYYISPFSAPNIISIPYLVQTSTKFARYSEFVNQSLGLTAQEENDAITEGDLDKALQPFPLYSSSLHCLGVDIGLTCHATVGRLDTDGTVIVVHRQLIHYTMLEETVRKVSSQYKIVVSVFDSQPYTDLITRICRTNPNSWGAIYTNPKNPSILTVQQQEADAKEGKMDLRLVKINRNAAFDATLALIKEGKLKVASQDDDDDWKMQMQSMKRIQKFDQNNELVMVWEKTGDENDHYGHSLVYLNCALILRGTAGTAGAAGIGVPLVSKFRLRN